MEEHKWTLDLGSSSQFSLDIASESLRGFAEGFWNWELDNSEYSDIFKTLSPLLPVSGLQVGTSINLGSRVQKLLLRDVVHI